MKSNINAAIEAHLAWTERFNDAIAHRVLPEAIRNAGYDDLCAFGKWLYGLDDQAKHSSYYRKVKDLHYRFHNEAAEIVRLMERSFFDDAKARLAGDYAAASQKLQAALRDWLASEAS